MFDKLIEYVSFPSVRYAVIAGILISLCAGLLGVILVLKRYAMIGDGLSHVAFGAMAVAAVMGLAPLTVAIPVTVGVAILLLLAGEKRLIKGDAAIAMLSAGALAIGYLLLHLFPSSGTGSLAGDVCSSLFGSTSMLTLDTSDVWLCVGLSVAVIGFFVIFYRKIFAVTFDGAFATTSGVHVRLYNFLIAAISGIVIVLAMKLVGALLISSLIIFPALSSMRVFRSFRAVVLCSGILAVAGSLAGLLAALLFSTPTGASVAVAHIVIFGAFSLVGKIKK